VKEAADRTRLHDIARRLSRSELLYVGQVFPWAAAHRQPALATLRDLIAAETQAVHAYVRWLLDQGVPAGHLGTFPTRLTTLSYLGLDHLLPRLLASQQVEVKTLERDLAALTDPIARAQVSTLLTMKKEHLFRLEVLVSEVAPPKTV
jgi:hypothetical protein